jgi:tetratricopeptide (TPR) repeat protein
MRRLRPIIGWAVFFFIAAVIAQSVPSVTGSYYFLKGKGLFAKGDYEAAVVAYERSVASDPEFLRGYVELGQSYLQLENYEKAEQAYKKAVSIQEDSCGQCGLGMVLHRQGRNDEAEKALKRAMALNPRDVCAINQLGRMYYKLDRYPEAVEAFQAEVKLRPSAIAYHFLGNSYLYSDQFEKALTAYDDALRVDPDYYRVYRYRGHAFNHLKRWPEAVGSYRKAIKANPNDNEAHLGLGFVELQRGNTKAALEQYEILQRQDSDWATSLLNEIEKKKGVEN